MDNDNNITPIEDARKFKIAAEGPKPEEPLNDAQDFEVAIIKPDTDVMFVNITGAIVATGVFVGIADADGFLQFVVPLDRLLYVRPMGKQPVVTPSVA